jgi:hypothetical protein
MTVSASGSSATEEERAQKLPYLEALPRYLTGLDSIFARAMERDEAQLILSLGARDPGYTGRKVEPYDTTVEAIAAATAFTTKRRALVARHLSLWIYDHIVEAAAP